MRKFLTGVLVFAVGAAAGLRADDDQSKKIALLPEQPRTMEQVIDRVTSNENHLYGKMREYSPLVETYIQNLKGDKELGAVPAGDRVRDDVLSALQNLGYHRPLAEKAVDSTLPSTGTPSFEQALRAALRELMR